MVSPDSYPYVLLNVFFARVKLERSPSMPPDSEVQIGIRTKIVKKDLPQKIEIQLEVKAPDGQLLDLDLLLIAFFELVDGVPEPDSDTISRYVQQRALHMLWAYVDQMVRLITSQMGMNPVCLKAPVNLGHMEL